MWASRSFGPGWRKLTLGALIVVLATAAIVSLPSAGPEARVPDNDRDGLSNRFERERSHTNPRSADTDGDRLRDGFEVRKSKTNPRRSDTDRDGYRDRAEVSLGSNPRNSKSIPRSCMRRPSACGFPDIETVGVKAPASQLKKVNRDVDLTVAGQVYENKDVRGCITVRAPNVTIRNVKISCGGVLPIRSIPSEGNTGGLVAEDIEVDQLGFLAGGIGFDNFTLRRAFIHNGGDCVSFEKNVAIEDSLCSLGPDANGDGWADSTSFCSGPEHFDGFQSGSVATNVTLRHNTIRNPCKQTSAILIGYVNAGSDDITIDRNLVAGGGYTVYCDQNHRATVTVTNNRFARTFFRRGGYFGPVAACKRTEDFSSNVWDDTTAPLRRR